MMQQWLWWLGHSSGCSSDVHGLYLQQADDSDPDFSESDASDDDSDEAGAERHRQRRAWKSAWRAWRGERTFYSLLQGL